MVRRLPPWVRVAAAMFAVGWGANQFAAMLLVYREEDGASAEAVTALFGAYALGLIPALLLVAPVSDRIGRRRVMRPVLVLSVVATVLLLIGGDNLPLLLIGRLASGVASGAAFAPGTAWVKELSADRPPGTGARRATLSLSAGFGTGPLVAGICGQWLAWPTVVPYVPHLVLMAVVLVIAWNAPEPVRVARQGGPRREAVLQAVGGGVFLRRVVLTAPWVFGAAATAFATVPTFVTIQTAPIASIGALTGLTLLTGAMVQPLGRRLHEPRLILVAGLLACAAGLGVGLGVAAFDEAWLLVPAVMLLGAAYGWILVGGLTTVEEVAHSDDLGTVNAVFYSLSYLGFAAPVLNTLALGVMTPEELMLAGIAVALLTIPVVVSGRPRVPRD